MRKKQRKSKKYWLIGLLFIVGLGLIFGGRRIVREINRAWSGKEQISLALEMENNDGLLLTLTPAKEMVVATRIPSKTMIDTPWFGAYQVGKLPLLAKQENKPDVFNRSLSYYLELPIEIGLANLNLKIEKFEPTFIKNKLVKLFFPPKSVTFWRIWRYLLRKDLVWKTIDLEMLGEKDFLADNSEIFRIKPEKIDQQFWGYFSDPVVKKEELTLSVFNVGGKKGLANRTSAIAQNMGVRVVEISDLEAEVDSCLFLVSGKKMIQTFTVTRLERVFGCQLKVGESKGIGDIALLIKNVKID